MRDPSFARQCQSEMYVQLTMCVSLCVSVSDVLVSMMLENASHKCVYSWQCVCLCVCLSVTYWCRWCQEMPVRHVWTADNVYVSVCVCQWRAGVNDVSKCQSGMYVQLTMCVSLCVSVSDVMVSLISDHASQRCVYSWQSVCLYLCLPVTYWRLWCQKMPVRDVCTADNVCVSCVSVSDVRVSMMSDHATQRRMSSWQCVCLCVCLSVTYGCRWCQTTPVRDVCTLTMCVSLCVSVCVWLSVTYWCRWC